MKFDVQNVPAAYLADPYACLAELRANAPVHMSPDGSFVLTRYADMVAIYRDAANWSSDKKQAFGQKFGNSALFEHHTTSVVFIDPPDHTRIRKLFQSAFTPKALQSYVPRISGLVDGYLDRLEDQRSMEVVEEFSFQLPIEIVCDLLGVPQSDRMLIRGWATAILTALEPKITAEQLQTGNQSVVDFKEYLRGLIRDRRRARTSTKEVLGVLTDAETDGKLLTEDELLHQCIFMLNAGHETSTNMLSHGIHEMLRNPSQIARLAEDPALIDPMVDEVLRYQAPIQINNRQAVSDQIVGGVRIPKGGIVHLMINAGNRDPEQFVNPDQFDIARRPNRHLSFGLGIHICAGNTLARMEAAIAFQKLFSRFANLRLDAPAKVSNRIRFREILDLRVSIG